MYNNQDIYVHVMFVMIYLLNCWTSLKFATLVASLRTLCNKCMFSRLIYTKKYIEEDDIQKNAMLVNKECKQLTYKLMEEHFISVQVLEYILCYFDDVPSSIGKIF